MNRKRLLELGIALGLTLTLATASADTLFVATANGKSVNMRVGAGKTHKIVTTVPNGFAVSTDEPSDDSDWLLCTYNGYRGYISGQFLSTMPGPINGFAVGCYSATVKPTRDTGYVNLRQKPAKSSKSIAQYQKGEELFVLRSNGTWSQVYDPASCDYGFMMSQFLVYEHSLEWSELTACLAESASLIPPPEDAAGTIQAYPGKDYAEVVQPYPGEDYADVIQPYPEEDETAEVQDYPGADSNDGTLVDPEFGEIMPSYPQE